MAGDELSDDTSEEANEGKSARKASSPRGRALPENVERALAKARAAAKADHAQKAGRWLAIIPVGLTVVVLAFLMPRSTPPDGIPVPIVDTRVTRAVAQAEDRLAAEAVVGERLPTDVLAVGSALRELNVAEQKDDGALLPEARRHLEIAISEAAGRKGVDADLIALRALQTRRFLDAIAAWEQGSEPADFIALGGGFVLRAQTAGWVRDRHVLLDETQRRVAFKTVWNALTHLDGGVFALTLDEERALYAFYIRHPRVPESHRLTLEEQRREARTPDACRKAQADDRREAELWRIDKIKRLAAMDAKYPADYALGIAYFRADRTDMAIASFTAYADAHPDGAYALRARNHLKAALASGAP